MDKKFLFFIVSFLMIVVFFINEKKLNEVIISFSVDDNYATFLPVTIESIKAHSDPNRSYKIFILGDNISENHAQSIYLTQSKNINIQIIDIQKLVHEKNINTLKTLGDINAATYYRFFIPRILKNYKKAVYLEADQILQEDVGKLFDINLNGKSLGVAPQPLYSGNQSKEWQNYCKNQLKMEKTDNYFNAGVLVMNLEKLRKNNFEEAAFKIARKNNFRYLDQDILNFMFSDDCIYI